MEKPLITVLLNSGSTLQEKANLEQTIAESFSLVNCKAQIVTIQKGDDFRAIVKSQIQQTRDHKGIMVAAGGDGTVNLIAEICYKQNVTLGVIPLGTFNYFARELQIPTNIEEAVKIIASGEVRKVSVGLVHDHVFLNNASFGLYTKIIRQREQASSRFGRMRIIAAVAAVYSLFNKHRLMSIRIHSAQEKDQHKTPMVFVGNNTLQLENLGLDVANCTKQDKLAVVIMQPIKRWETAMFIFLGAIRKLKDQSRLKEYCADDFEVTTNHKIIDLVIDGEIIKCATPLKFRVEKNALSVIVPPPAQEG